MDGFQEKRHEERFMLEMPVLLESGSGMSRDISESGIYFTTTRQLVPGEGVKFSVRLDHLHVRLDCVGQVLRIEAVDGIFGVAASIRQAWCIN